MKAMIIGKYLIQIIHEPESTTSLHGQLQKEKDVLIVSVVKKSRHKVGSWSKEKSKS
jgi:hypothetical protein